MDKDDDFGATLAKIGAIVFFAAVGIACAVDEGEVRRTIREQFGDGATRVEVGELAGGCARGDRMGRKFSATMRDGSKLKGVVCCGLEENTCYARH